MWPGDSDTFPGPRDIWIGIVTGMAAEARIAAHKGPALPGGGTARGAEQAARRLVRHGAAALISFGVAAGLDPALKPGSLVIASEVLYDDILYPCDAALAGRWGARHGRMLTSPVPVVTAGEKARLFATTGACAVDMESGPVARIALERNLPFACVRAVCDPAHRTLPPAALVALDRGGHIAPLRLLASLARDPRQIGTLLALGRDAAAARAALKKTE